MYDVLNCGCCVDPVEQHLVQISVKVVTCNVTSCLIWYKILSIKICTMFQIELIVTILEGGECI